MSYFSVSDFYKQKFGSKVYKISIDAGCTCPTRDGSKSTGGCIFCSAAGSGDFAASRTLSISEQIEEAKKRVDSKFPKKQNKKYIAYFQNFTNTYGDAIQLKQKYYQALACPGVKAIAIATRPDCLSGEILQILQELAQKTFVIVELGLQTSDEKTAEYIRRGYKTPVFEKAVKALHECAPNIHVVCHVIFGLPGESAEKMIKTVQYAVNCGIDGIKICVLHILEGTDLAEEWRNGKIKCLNMEEYFEILGQALKIIPPGVVIHRLTGDGAKRILLAPMWTADKKRVHNALKKYIESL